MTDFQEQNEPKQSQEVPLEVEADVLDFIRNNAIAACLGILKYIAIVAPRFFCRNIVLCIRQIVHYIPTLVNFTFKLTTLGLVLFCLAVLLAWPYMYGQYLDDPEFWFIVEIIWLLFIGLPGAYLGLKSHKKWRKQWQNWRSRVKAAKHQSKQ